MYDKRDDDDDDDDYPCRFWGHGNHLLCVAMSRCLPLQQAGLSFVAQSETDGVRPPRYSGLELLGLSLHESVGMGQLLEVDAVFMAIDGYSHSRSKQETEKQKTEIIVVAKMLWTSDVVCSLRRSAASTQEVPCMKQSALLASTLTTPAAIVSNYA